MVMVLSLALTAMVGCKPDDKEDETLELSNALQTVIDNSVEDNLLNNLKASAKLSVKTNYGGSEKELAIKFAGYVALKTDDENTTVFNFAIEDAKANSNILSVTYQEYLADETEGTAAAGDLFVTLGAGNTAKKYWINAISIKDTLSRFFQREPVPETEIKDGKEVPKVDDKGNVIYKKDADGNVIYQDKTDDKGNKIDLGVTDDDANDISENITSGLGDFLSTLDMIASVGKLSQTNANNIRLTIDLAKALTDLSDLLAVIDEYTVPLGLNLTSSNIASVLPGLTLNLDIKLNDGKMGNFEDATLAGMAASIDVKSKDIKINRTDNSTFLEVNVAKNFKLDLGFDFKFGEIADNANYVSDYDSYTNVNALNFEVGGDLVLNQDLGVDFKISDSFTLNIAIPKDTYDFKFAIDVDPFKLVEMADPDFGLDFSKDLSGSINKIAALQAVKYLGIEIVPKSETNTNKLRLYLFNRGDRLMVRAKDLSLLGSLGTQMNGFLSTGALSIGDLLDKLMPIINPPKKDEGNTDDNKKDETTDKKDEEEKELTDEEKAALKKEQTEKTLALVKTIIEKLSILVNQPNNANLIDVDFKEYKIKDNYKNVQAKDSEGNLMFEKDKDGNDVPVYVQKKDDKNELMWETDKNGNFVLDKDGKKIPVYEQELIDTTKISAKVALSKANGLNIKATLSGMVIDGIKCGSLTADITVKNGVSIAVKAPDLKLNNGEIPMNIDLVLNITSFSFGTAARPSDIN